MTSAGAWSTSPVLVLPCAPHAAIVVTMLTPSRTLTRVSGQSLTNLRMRFIVLLVLDFWTFDVTQTHRIRAPFAFFAFQNPLAALLADWRIQTAQLPLRI